MKFNKYFFIRHMLALSLTTVGMIYPATKSSSVSSVATSPTSPLATLELVTVASPDAKKTVDKTVTSSPTITSPESIGITSPTREELLKQAKSQKTLPTPRLTNEQIAIASAQGIDTTLAGNLSDIDGIYEDPLPNMPLPRVDYIQLVIKALQKPSLKKLAGGFVAASLTLDAISAISMMRAMIYRLAYEEEKYLPTWFYLADGALATTCNIALITTIVQRVRIKAHKKGMTIGQYLVASIRKNRATLATFGVSITIGQIASICQVFDALSQGDGTAEEFYWIDGLLFLTVNTYGILRKIYNAGYCQKLLQAPCCQTIKTRCKRWYYDYLCFIMCCAQSQNNEAVTPGNPLQDNIRNSAATEASGMTTMDPTPTPETTV